MALSDATAIIPVIRTTPEPSLDGSLGCRGDRAAAGRYDNRPATLRASSTV